MEFTRQELWLLVKVLQKQRRTFPNILTTEELVRIRQLEYRIIDELAATC